MLASTSVIDIAAVSNRQAATTDQFRHGKGVVTWNKTIDSRDHTVQVGRVTVSRAGK